MFTAQKQGKSPGTARPSCRTAIHLGQGNKRYEDFRYPGFRNQNNSVFRKGIHFLGIALFEEIAVALAPFSVTLRKCVVALLPHTVHMPEGMCKVNHARLIRMQTEVLRGGGYWYVGDKSPVLEEFRNEMQIYERMSYMAMLRSEAFRDMPAALWRFESAAVTTPQLAKARGYAQNWDECKKAGIGLLLFGNVGTGKSYAAGCITNALIDRLESVLFVGMSDVVNRMQGNFGADRDSYMTSLMRPELLILDDLGAERNTSFGKERVFDVINRRRLTGKPMIITTNIPIVTMQKGCQSG